jgi:hypothetical protein
VEFVDDSVGGATNHKWKHYVQFRKISNTMFTGTYAEQFMGEATTVSNSEGSLQTAKYDPVVRFVFSPQGTFGLAVSGNAGSDSTGGYWSGHRYFATRFDGAFGEVWRNNYDFNRYSLFFERLSDPAYSDEHCGIGLDGVLRFNAQFFVQQTPQDTPVYREFCVRFNTETGAALDTLSDRRVYHNTVNQNGFTYRHRVHGADLMDQWIKAPLGGTSPLWSLGGQAINRLHFQLMGAARTSIQDHPALVVTRFRDTDGRPSDETQFLNTFPRKVLGVAQQADSGISMVVGERLFDDDRKGAWIARLGQAPVANNNSYTTRQNTALIASSILGNDRFVAGLSPHIVTQPRNGLLYMNLDGTFRYVPRANYVGSDIFTYRLQRIGLAATPPASVFIQITQ